MEDKKRLIDTIVDLELEMFLSVPADGVYSCQQDPQGFTLHRRVQFAYWSQQTLNSYADDLSKAKSTGINLLTIKYARMEKRIVSRNPNPLIDTIVEIQMRWQHAMIKKYPGIMAAGRPLSKTEDSAHSTSFETYLRGELETYSDATLNLLLRDMSQIEDRGENGSEIIYTQLVRKMGYADLDEAERQQKGNV